MTKPQSGSEARIQTQVRGRICDNSNCNTTLSIYNDGEFCSRHEPMSAPRTRGVKLDS